MKGEEGIFSGERSENRREKRLATLVGVSQPLVQRVDAGCRKEDKINPMLFV